MRRRGGTAAPVSGRPVAGFWRRGGAARPDDDVRRDEARLVDGLRRRAPSAFAGLHEEYAAGIYNLALRVVRHGPDAEDITQDVLLRAFERVPVDREVLLRPWLYRLTLNRCYDHLRSTRRVSAADVQDAPSPLDPFEQSELQRLLERALTALTPRQRAAMLLKDVHGLTLVEVGTCLDLTPGSVEVLLARARTTFRRAYEDECAAAGQPSPRAAVGLAGLLWLPLPAGLGLGALRFTPPAHVPPAAALPALPLGGGGIVATLGLPASLKTALMVAAAAATVGSAEVAATHTTRHASPRTPVVASRVEHTSPAVSPSASSAGAGRGVASGSAPASPTPSSSASATSSPTPTGTPDADDTPTATDLPSVSPSPGDPGTGRAATPTASPSPTASPTADPSPGASPDGSGSPAPEAGSPSPGAASSPSPSPADGA